VATNNREKKRLGASLSRSAPRQPGARWLIFMTIDIAAADFTLADRLSPFLISALKPPGCHHSIGNSSAR